MKYTKMDEYLQSNDFENLHEENVNSWTGGITPLTIWKDIRVTGILINTRFDYYASLI